MQLLSQTVLKIHWDFYSQNIRISNNYISELKKHLSSKSW